MSVHSTGLPELAYPPITRRRRRRVNGARPGADGLAHAPAAFRTALDIAHRNWAFGTLIFELPSGRELRVDGAADGPAARLVIHDFAFVGRVLAAADIGFGEGYMAGEWDTPDLAALLEAFTLNFDRLEKLVEGNLFIRGLNALAHMFNRNSRRGSRRNIHAHYDLGNEFYSLWLDPGMTYSSALYRQPRQTLVEAQREKYLALAESIDLRAGERVLEIGCGWGGFAEFAAGEIGARVSAVTISRAQYDYARERIFEAGLADRAEIKLIDYRDIQGRYDKVASIEMFEAVGEAYWPTFFGKVGDLLEPGGKAGLQIITIRDDLFPVYRKRSDFMRKYVFPGGMLPCEQRLAQETARAGFSWLDIQRFGQDYARTLAMWTERFEARWDDIKVLGFDERFRRLWRFYLRYCESAFLTGRTNVVQLGLLKV